jgi:hypothetical protein
MFSLPTTTEGNIAGAVGVLAAGTALGAAAGWAASPATPAGNKTVGAIEGGTVGVLATAFAGLLIGEWKPKYKKLGEMTGLVGVGAVVAMAALGATKKAAAGTQPAQIPPTPATQRTLAPQGTATNSSGGRSFMAAISDSGSLVPMRVKDQLTISLPGGGPSSSDWFAFDGTGQPVSGANGYPGLTFSGRNTQPMSGGSLTQYTYTATGPGAPQIVFQLFPTDANGAAIAGSRSTATFALSVSIQ